MVQRVLNMILLSVFRINASFMPLLVSEDGCLRHFATTGVLATHSWPGFLLPSSFMHL